MVCSTVVYRFSELNIGKGEMEVGEAGTKTSLHKEIGLKKHLLWTEIAIAVH